MTDYSISMNEIFERVSQNKPFDKGLCIYSKSRLSETISYFEFMEEYEKCQFLSSFIKSRFDHYSGYKKKED